MNQQVVLIASNIASNITVWDVQTGTALTTYKGNTSPTNGIALLGRDYLIATQLGKPALHVWTWHKDQVHLRSFPPEALTAVTCTIDGVYCAGGGASGALHIWETSTGRLLRSWHGHYKRVSCLAFTDHGRELITGGDDTIVTAWLLAEVLDVGTTQSSPAGPTPFRSWTDHTLPVTAVAVGAGGINALVASTSLDRSIKVRSLGTGAVLRTIALPSPLTSLVLDPGEHALYVGSAFGSVYDVSLVGWVGPEGQEYVEMGKSHGEKAVTALALSGDASLLVSGGEDSSVRVWDLRSRQIVRTLDNPAKGAVSGLIVCDRPPNMPVGAVGGGKGPGRPQALSQLSKYPGAVSGAMKPWDGAMLILDSTSELVGEWRGVLSEAQGGSPDGTAALT